MDSKAGSDLAPAPQRSTSPTPIEPIVWITTATLALFLSIADLIQPDTVFFILGLLTIALGARIFLRHGHDRITALGLFAISSSIVVGAGAIQEVVSPQNRTAPIYLEIAVYVSFMAQSLVCFIAWKARLPAATLGPMLDPRQARAIRWVACCGLAVLIAFILLDNSRSQLMEASAFAAITLVALGTLGDANRSPKIFGVLVIGGSLAAYAQLFQGGTGRLRLVALACTIAVIWATAHPRRYLKCCLLALTPVAIAGLALQRLSLQESIRAGASFGRTGLESMTEPVLVFAQVIQAQVERGWPPAGGSTLLTLPISLIPNSAEFGSLSEPIGYQLVRITDPARYGTGYSVAATTFGEWWYNFSAYSVLFVVLFLVLFLRFLDRSFLRAAGRLRLLHEGTLRFAVVAMACGSIADLAWMGLHIYGARMLWRMPATILIVFCATAIAGRGPRSKTDPLEPENSMKLSGLGSST